MRKRIEQSDYDEIEQLVNNALCSPSKKAAELYTKRLDFIANAGGYEGPAHIILCQLAAATKSASGRVADKERRSYFAKMELYKLTSYVGDEKDA